MKTLQLTMQNYEGFMELLTTKRGRRWKPRPFLCQQHFTLVKARTLGSTFITRFTSAKTIHMIYKVEYNGTCPSRSLEWHPIDIPTSTIMR
jgi:hypothetical protein